jgi:hypothetical protein
MKDQPIMKDRVLNQFPESHKRTMSGNPADSIRMNKMGEITKLLAESEKPENKSPSVSPEETDKLIELLPDNKAFEDAILGIDEAGKPADTMIYQRKIEKRGLRPERLVGGEKMKGKVESRLKSEG